MSETLQIRIAPLARRALDAAGPSGLMDPDVLARAQEAQVRAVETALALGYELGEPEFSYERDGNTWRATCYVPFVRREQG
jgi:hypothetical protein